MRLLISILLIITNQNSINAQTKSNQICEILENKYKKNGESTSKILSTHNWPIAKRIYRSKKLIRKNRSLLKSLNKNNCLIDRYFTALVYIHLSLGNKNKAKKEIKRILNNKNSELEQHELSIIESMIAVGNHKKKNSYYRTIRRRKTTVGPCPVEPEDNLIRYYRNDLEVLKEKYGCEFALKYIKHQRIAVNGSTKYVRDDWIEIYKLFKSCLQEKGTLNSFIEEYSISKNKIYEFEENFRTVGSDPHHPFVMNSKKKVNDYIFYTCFNHKTESGKTTKDKAKQQFKDSLFMQIMESK